VKPVPPKVNAKPVKWVTTWLSQQKMKKNQQANVFNAKRDVSVITVITYANLALMTTLII
jgi:hypothetical protein